MILPRIAIIGGGFSGVALACRLLRERSRPFALFIIEPRESLGRGVAYGTERAEHLLNVPAGKMSLYPEMPDHFRAWAGCDANDFRPRREYAEYLAATLEAEMRQAEGRAAVSRVHDAVLGARRNEGGWTLQLAQGGRMHADVVVLATGNPPHADPFSRFPDVSADERYLRSPWQASFPRQVGVDDKVLVIGSGLTMVDAVISLAAQGHRGGIVIASRRGLLPKAHAPATLPPDLKLHQALALLVHMQGLAPRLHAFRRIVRERGVDWRMAMDALRPLTARLWQGLSLAERCRFIRHLRPWWDVHRHRMAPEVARKLQVVLERENVSLHAARIFAARRVSRGFVVELVERGTQRRWTRECQWIVNCTGPDFREAAQRPLEAQLLRDGLLATDALGLGFDADASGRVQVNDELVPGLYLLGPARRGDRWEATAVPELRVDAENLAQAVLSCAPFSAAMEDLVMPEEFAQAATVSEARP